MFTKCFEGWHSTEFLCFLFEKKTNYLQEEGQQKVQHECIHRYGA